MICSNLDLTLSSLPSNTAFDLTTSRISSPSQTHQWYALHTTPAGKDLSKGDLWIDYNYVEPLMSLPLSESEDSDAYRIRKNTLEWIEAITAYGTQNEIYELHTRWALSELIVNATQYGALSETNQRCGLVRLEWNFQQETTHSDLSISISNPIPRIFDPTRYARMTIEDFFSMEPSEHNAHEGTNTLLAFLKPKTSLNYLWELKSGGRIFLEVHPISEDAANKPTNFDSLKRPVTTNIAKISENNTAVDYSFEQFLSDIEAGLKTESVTISCTLTSKQGIR